MLQLSPSVCNNFDISKSNLPLIPKATMARRVTLERYPELQMAPCVPLSGMDILLPYLIDCHHQVFGKTQGQYQELEIHKHFSASMVIIQAALYRVRVMRIEASPCAGYFFLIGQVLTPRRKPTSEISTHLPPSIEASGLEIFFCQPQTPSPLLFVSFQSSSDYRHHDYLQGMYIKL